ncbi:MAG: LytTR family transcriptional regulator, partial [Oscillospiraceae bacterium]|nr:LytTR family transcriptional regulator [Oscillospiraceae bacterium]
KFCEVLDRAQKSLTQSGGSALFLQTDEGNVRIASDEIVYVESFDHFLEINALSKKHTVKMPLYELESTLGGSFVRSHRCYIVNLKYVKKITKTEITLDSNEVVPLSRRLYTEANRAMAKYIKEGKNR